MFANTRFGFAAVMLVAAITFANDASATIIHESATLGETGIHPGLSVFGEQFVGSKFSLASATNVTSIAGHLQGSGSIFGAIVSLTGDDLLPAGNPFDLGVVLASGTFDVAFPSAERSLALSLTLGPGDYGVIFGSGLFGATGSASMPFSQFTGAVDIGSPSYFLWDGDLGEWRDTEFSSLRFVVYGESVGVPEPATFGLLGLGLAAMAGLRRRKRMGVRPGR